MTIAAIATSLLNAENVFCPNATSAPLTATAITVITVAIGAMVEITVPIIAWSCANSGVIERGVE